MQSELAPLKQLEAGIAVYKACNQGNSWLWKKKKKKKSSARAVTPTRMQSPELNSWLSELEEPCLCLCRGQGWCLKLTLDACGASSSWWRACCGLSKPADWACQKRPDCAAACGWVGTELRLSPLYCLPAMWQICLQWQDYEMHVKLFLLQTPLGRHLLALRPVQSSTSSSPSNPVPFFFLSF